MRAERVKLPIVAPDAIVLVVAASLLAQLPILLLQWAMAMTAASLPQRLLRLPDVFASRFPLDDPVAPARSRPVMGQSELRECAVLSVALLAGCRLPERDQHRLRRMNGEAEVGNALREDSHDPAGALFPLAAGDKVVGTAEQKSTAFHPGFDVALIPYIQDFMQENIGQQRRAYTSYKVAKRVIEFSANIPRANLRPRYGDRFLGAF
jgi:hypothetical protein